MPEQQASPSSPPPSAVSNDGQKQPQQDVLSSPESVKRTYLSLLPPPQLIDLILAIDANRQMVIFPHDLDSAIKALQRPQRQPSPLASKETPPAVSVLVKAEPVSNSLPPQQSHTPPAQPQPPPVQPPQYRPPQTHPSVYPYAHTPYYPPPPQPQPQPHIPPPTPPVRHPLFTSAPLTRDPNKPPVSHPTPPPPVSSRDDPNAMPSYEEMIVEAIMDVGESEGTAPKVLFGWMASHYPLQQNFRPSASQALHKALKRGRLEKLGGKYRLNPGWGGGPTTSKRATRRPTANRALSPHAHAHAPPGGSPPTPAPTYPHPHPPYGYGPYGHHPSLPPHPHQQSHPYSHPYGPNGWGPPQTIGQALNGVGPASKAEEVNDEGEDSEGMEGQDPAGATEVTVEDERKREEIRRSLERLARLLKRVARRPRTGGAVGMPIMATM